MIKIIIGSEKGGVGKTTTCAALSAGLVQRGYKVLSIDMDGQCNFTATAGLLVGNKIKFTVDDIIDNPDTDDILMCKISTSFGDFIPGSKNMIGEAADKRHPEFGTFNFLKTQLSKHEDEYDFCIIDTPPYFGLSLISSLVAGDYIIIPAMTSVFSLQGMNDITKHIEQAKVQNANLQVLGILLTQFRNTGFAKDAVSAYEQIAKSTKIRFFKTTIRQAVDIERAHSVCASIYDYAPKSKVASDYNEFVDEVLNTLKKPLKKKQ